jgi:hypothetical protein
MIDDGVASKILVTVTRTGMETTKEVIQILRPDQAAPDVFIYFFNWETQLISRG